MTKPAGRNMDRVLTNHEVYMMVARAVHWGVGSVMLVKTNRRLYRRIRELLLNG